MMFHFNWAPCEFFPGLIVANGAGVFGGKKSTYPGRKSFFHNFGSLDPSSLSFPYQPEKTHQSLMDGNGGWKPLPK